MNPEKPSVLFTEEVVRRRVEEMARRISSDYADVEDLLLVGILRGCFIFLADLSRLLTVPRSVDFIAVSSYGRTTTSTGAVRLIMDLRTEISGKHVLIVDDIVDTGTTLQYLIHALKPRGPASLKTCVFLRKRERFKMDCEIDYLGCDIPDVWVVGYGLDYADQHRTLPYVGSVKT
jgi:hypoxanthine phosphoribosyltransferase